MVLTIQILSKELVQYIKKPFQSKISYALNRKGITIYPKSILDKSISTSSFVNK